MKRNTLYITENGCRLKRWGLMIRIYDKSGVIIREVPAINLGQIVIIGRNEISSGLLDLCFKKDIGIHYISAKGFYKYTVTDFNYNRVRLRLAQYEKCLNQDFSLNMAKAIVKAKIKNQYIYIKRYSKKRKDLDENIYRMNVALKIVESKDDVDKVMGIEGISSKIFFESYGKIITENYGFTSRNKRPPRDPVNALLSFGYTLLYKKILSAVFESGLDPFLSFLHKPKDRRYSLPLDLMEQFRTPIVDSLIASLLNKNIMSGNDFFYDEDNIPKLHKESIGKFIKSFEKRLDESIKDHLSERKTTYRQLFKEQVSRCKKCIAVDDSNYPAFSWR